ncbi:hypothetical protein Pmani_017713 [Petrolisthes manimaculis]|uniref:Uncharacterized protein n=1 Tax=Petrolisthes manimaculis TaxID=1843537 RepID=A0AAE1PLA1_9EUCA|nr:hypothetical protein Pmani_017713 [Petrolisthes manimaculis]
MHLLSDTNTLPAFSLAKKMAEVILMVLVLLLSRADCQSEECLQLNDTTVLQKPLIPRVYMRPSTPTDQQPIMSSATLCWRIDDDDDDSECEETMNFNISNENNEWRELKIISTTLRDGDALTVVIMEDFVDVFEGNINKSTTADQPMQKGDVDEDVVLGKLMVNTSTNLIWAIDCHKVPIPMTPSEQGRTSSTSPPPPPPPPTTTPHMTTATPNSTQEKTATDNNYNWKPLAIITLVILLLTLLCVVYRYVKDPMNKRRRNDSDNRSVANSIHNGKDMDIDSVEGGLHSSVSHSSNTAISTNNSISHDHNHRRSRLPSNATTYKGERKSVALHVDGNKNGNTMGRENSYMTKTIPATAAPPPPPPPVLKSIPPPPISSPLPRPSYAPPMPFDVAAKKDIDVNEDDEEHDYDYLDLNMLKVQMEKDKTEEEKMRKMRLDSTMTRHSSENSLYETISITADQRKTPEELDMMQSKNIEEKEEKTNKMKKGETRCLVTYDSVNSLYEACFANSKKQTEDKVIKQDGGGDDDDDDESEQEEQDEIQIKKRVEEESDNCSLPESSSQTEEGDISDAVDDNKQNENEGNDNEDEDNDNKQDDDDRESENNNEDEDNDNKHDDDDRESENNNESDVSDDDNESESSHEFDVSENVDQQEDIMNREGNSDNDEQNDEDEEEEKDNDHNIKETDNKVSESQAAESENINQKDMNGGEGSIDTDEEEKKSKNDTDEIIKCSTKL